MRSLSLLLEDATQSLLKKFGPLYWRLVANWTKIVGEDLALLATPKKVVDSNGRMVLYLAVKGANALLVQHSTNFILEKIHLFFGSRVIVQIKVIKV